jgi:hypothetical protein
MQFKVFSMYLCLLLSGVRRCVVGKRSTVGSCTGDPQQLNCAQAPRNAVTLVALDIYAFCYKTKSHIEIKKSRKGTIISSCHKSRTIMLSNYIVKSY